MPDNQGAEIVTLADRRPAPKPADAQGRLVAAFFSIPNADIRASLLHFIETVAIETGRGGTIRF
ncbi:MAG TPA: hypothetical protein VEH84_17300 [Alphaproteobacteria bacterium]|nr:hypothetical protein [Alphaproteobacteria bacterium]